MNLRRKKQTYNAANRKNLLTKINLTKRTRRNVMTRRRKPMLEENPCLWDVFHKDYSKRDVKEIAYKSIATAFDTNISSVKTKINGLRAQLGREKAKETKTKSGQSTDELYVSTWAHYNRLVFLLPVMGHSKSRETLRKKKDIELENDGNNNDDDIGESPVHIPKKRSIAERKLDLLTKCTEAITTKKTDEALVKEPKVSPFSLYVEEKLNNFDKRKRAIAEKRTTDVIFDVEMSSEMNIYTVNSSSVQPRTSNAAQNFQSQYYDMSGNHIFECWYFV